MTISRTVPVWTEIHDSPQLSNKAIGYFRARLSNKLHQLVLGQYLKLEATGLTKAKIARRLNKDPAQITRLLGAPGNWTLDTVSDLLLSMGYEPSLSLIYVNNNPMINALLQQSATEPPGSAQSITPDKTSAASALQFAGEKAMAPSRLGSMHEVPESTGMPV